MFFLCESISKFDTPADAIGVHDDETPPNKARNAIRVRALVGLFRELLKLGSGVMDRALAKELFKVVAYVAEDLTWITSALVLT